MDFTNIPAAISIFDVNLVYNEEYINGRDIECQEIFELPVQPQLIFKNNSTIVKVMDSFSDEVKTQIHQICVLTQVHARSLERISSYLTKIQEEAFDVKILFNDLQKYYDPLNNYITDDAFIKLLMLDISKANLSFEYYFRGLLDGKIDNLGDLNWNILIGDAIVLNKMIFKDQKVKLNLLSLTFFAKKTDLTICGPLLNLFTNFMEIQKNNSTSFEKFHVSYEVFKYNCCVEFCNSFLEKKLNIEKIDKFKIGNLEFEILEMECKQVWTLPLYMWFDKPNNKNYENKFIIFEKLTQNLHPLGNKTIGQNEELFSTISNSDSNFIKPKNWEGHEASLSFQTFDKSGRKLSPIYLQFI